MRRSIALVLVAVVAWSTPAGGEPLVDGFPACGRPGENVPPGGPRNVELATITDTEFVVTWLTCSADGMPAPADTTVTYWDVTAPAAPHTFRGLTTPFHVARVSGLRPGTRYAYRVSSSGLPGTLDRLNPGAFETLTPPRGRERFRLGILADTHLGETTSGLATSTPFEFPPSYGSDRPYPSVMAAGAVAGLNRERVSFTILPADQSSHGELHDLRDLRRVLGRLDGGFLAARGAHDRANQHDASRAECGPDGDCFRKVFRPREPARRDPRHRPAAVVHRGWTLIALDSANVDSGVGELDDAQRSWLRDRLEAARRRRSPAIVFMHHPVAHYSTTLAVPPAVFGVNHSDANAFLELIAGYDVRLVVSSHTHRNWIAYDPRTGRTPLIEVGPSKEYPGGYSVVRVFDGGFLRTWFPTDCPFCNAWREATRGEYAGLYPLYTTGSLRDRNFVHRFDAPDVPGVPSVPVGAWPPFACVA